QRIFEAEKYGSITSPVRSPTISVRPAVLQRSHRAAVRRSCHTIALFIGRPLARSHRTVVSRWLVMPTAAIGPSAPAIASRQVDTTLCQISSGSCSTQPGRGYNWVSATCALCRGCPAVSNRIARVGVVPWATARTRGPLPMPGSLRRLRGGGGRAGEERVGGLGGPGGDLLFRRWLRQYHGR